MDTRIQIGSMLSKMGRKKLGLVIASLLVVTATLVMLIVEGTKKTVAVTLDGEEVIVKTHAKTIGDVMKELNIEVKEDDFLSHPKDALLENKLDVVWEPAKQVVLQDGEEKETVLTTAKTVEQFLTEQNIDLSEHDQLSVKSDEIIKNNMNIAIDRAFPLVVKNGTKEEEAWSTSTTVADFLKNNGIALGELDRVEPGLDEMVEKDGIIQVIRVEKVTDVVEEPVDFAVVTKKDSDLMQGTEKVVQQGRKGLLKKEYEVTKENGKEVNRSLVSESTLEKSQDKIVAVGTKVIVAQASRGKPASTQAASAAPAKASAPASGGKEYTMKATAYSAYCNGCSGVTATGINLRANPNAKVIAVDPNVIPLGSKVWVEGYGYAVAGDTGGAIKGNRVDLHVGSRSQAASYGIKTVKVRVLN